MDKTMTRFLAILAALTCAASAQTYRTVTADTNNVIRTNFTLGSAQVSGAFAISNVTGLQSALDGKLATNGDGSGLTNLPNANLTNATGVLPLSNGGTGQTNAALAIETLLPAYTNNANKILALNSNATSLLWTTNAGGGGGGSGITTNINIRTFTSASNYVIYTNNSDFTNAAGTNNTLFNDNLTNAPTDIINAPLYRTNAVNSYVYSLGSDTSFLIGFTKGAQTWIADGGSGAQNIIWSTTNTNVGAIGLYVFATDVSENLQTNVTFSIVVNGTSTNSFTATSSNSFFGVIHTSGITNVKVNSPTNNRYATTRGVFVSTTMPVPLVTNNVRLQISNGSILTISNL